MHVKLSVCTLFQGTQYKEIKQFRGHLNIIFIIKDNKNELSSSRKFGMKSFHFLGRSFLKGFS